MKADIDSFWLLALASKCQHLSSQAVAYSALLIIGLTWLAMSLAFWAHQGGPAWGKYYRLVKNRHSSIPGPRGLPLVGSMSMMASALAHRQIAAASEKCSAKRLMAFSLGDKRVVVTCNPDVAREILNSSVFADRPVKQSAYKLMFDRAIGFASYGVYWRTLRRIAAAHLFCPKQIRVAEERRRLIAVQMGDILSGGKNVCVREVVKRASLTNMMGLVFGRSYGLERSDGEVEEVRALVEEGYELLGTLNWSDHFAWLADLDLQKIRRRCSKLVPKVKRFVGGIIEEHGDGSNGEVLEALDFVHVLLRLQGAEKLAHSDMIAVLWEMIIRGTDTVAVLIEWILARIVLHPGTQSIVHAELDRIVGISSAVQENDITKLQYLTAVIKEVLRLHPPGPLLSWARLAITDTIVDGSYHVPKGTTAMVNMWAISRDPDSWADPLEFRPERFLGVDGESGFSAFRSDLRLAPFGSGRRVCPGKNLGLTTVTFWVAHLLHEFEWLPSDVSKVDLSEVLKLSCEMANPLCANVRPRCTPIST